MISSHSQKSRSRVLVIPSMGFSGLTRKYLTGLDAFEERGLYNLSRLLDADTEVHVVTSDDLDPALIDHGLDMIAKSNGANSKDLRERLSITKLATRGNKSLSSKLLELSIEEIEALWPQPPSEIDFWIYGRDEARFSEAIGVAPQGNDGAHDLLDSKSNTRRIFETLGIPTPPGRDAIFSLEQALETIRELQSPVPGGKFILKLNNEDGGMGIGMIDGLSPEDDVTALRAALKTARNLPVQEFELELSRQGGVLERFVEFPFTSAPSVKMEVLGDGTFRNLATHEQIMDGTACAGCSFPANADYRVDLIRLGYRVAHFAALKGFRGIISIDFLAVKSRPEDQWQLLGIEINARKGGTTHPYFWTKSVTNAKYDEKEGVLISGGEEIIYACHESIGHPKMKRIPATAVLSRIKDAGLLYDRDKDSGVIVHMVGRLQTCGTIGVTIIGRTGREIEEILNDLNATVRKLTSDDAETLRQC